MIEAVVIWNEPNNLSHWNFHFDPGWKSFASMVKQTSDLIRACNPSLPIVLGGVSSCDCDFLRLMRSYGVMDFVDIVGVHGFPLDWNHWQIEEWPDRVEEARDVSQKTCMGHGGVLIHGVRYPSYALKELDDAGVVYAGYLPNLDAPSAYAAARVTMHIPRQHYSRAMRGVPTIRVFEALACGIPLISAPWEDTELLFRHGDFLFVRNHQEAIEALRYLLTNRPGAEDQARRGLETILARHTCGHRAEELMQICEEVLS